MTVYIISQITIHDRTTYDEYEAGFMEIFEKYEGTMLSVDENARRLEGEWTATRSVLMSFPSVGAFRAWAGSKEYQAIAKLRHAASVTNSIMVKEGFEKAENAL
ncbi:MAG: DUF1330 domain-containing protein [Chloroflexota bacterium]